MASQQRKAALPFILVTLFLDVLGIGLLVPIIPNLVKHFVGGSSEVASHYTGPLMASYALMQFIFSPIIGSLSDRYGRRPVLLLAVAGQGIDYVLMGLAPSLWWLFMARIVSGITGASFGTGAAYIADVSPPEKRAQNFGLIGIAFGLGFIVGPLMGGVLGKINIHLPFFAAAGLTLLNAAWGFFVLPESLPPERRRAFEWSRANPVGTLSALGKYPLVRALIAPVFIGFVAQRCLENNWVLANGERFGWDERASGISLAMVGLAAAAVQGGVVRRVVPMFGERRTYLAGLTIAIFSFLGYGLATSPTWVYVIIPFGALAGMVGPSVQAILSKSVPPTEQGMLQGGLTSLQSLSSIIGPLLANGAFGFFISDRAPLHLPGVAFLIGSALWLTVLLLSLRAFSQHPVAKA